MPKRLPRPESETPPARPILASEPPCFLRLEREVEIEFRPVLLAALQSKVDAVADPTPREAVLTCTQCGQTMHYQDIRPVTWLARFGKLHASVARYRCPACRAERRPLLDVPGVEPGRICGGLARLLTLLATVVPFPLGVRLAWLLLGVNISPMTLWRLAQRMGEAAAQYTDALSLYHGDSRSSAAPTTDAPKSVVLAV